MLGTYLRKVFGSHSNFRTQGRWSKLLILKRMSVFCLSHPFKIKSRFTLTLFLYVQALMLIVKNVKTQYNKPLLQGLLLAWIFIVLNTQESQLCRRLPDSWFLIYKNILHLNYWYSIAPLNHIDELFKLFAITISFISKFITDSALWHLVNVYF